MKHVLGGMFLMLVLLRPQVLADIATSVSLAFQPPVERGNTQVASISDYGHDTVLPGEEKLDWIQLRTLEALERLSEGKSPARHRDDVDMSSTSYFPIERPLNSDPSAVSAKKRAAYERALMEQEILEKHVNYFGDDPIVRKRLNLPPKLKSINDFDFEGEDEVTLNDFDRLFNSKFKN